MYLHNDCAHYDDCDYLNDVGSCPRVCGQYRHKDDVRVVRCKDCKYGDMCSIREAMCCTDENGFCYRGERKDNE